MITRHNTSTLEQVSPEEYEAYGVGLERLTSMSDVISNLEKRRGINHICSY